MNNSGILGIENLTENWKTAQTFLKLKHEKKLSSFLALLGFQNVDEEVINMELFWKGFRDCCKKENVFPFSFNHPYNNLFNNLKTKLANEGFELNDVNYNSNCIKSLFSNMKNQEIDIVIETPKQIFIGEAKYTTKGFSDNKKYFLPHQFIRQYVTTKLLLNHKQVKKEVIQFLVCEKKTVKKFEEDPQVLFMKKYYKFKLKRIIPWEDIELL